MDTMLVLKSVANVLSIMVIVSSFYLKVPQIFYVRKTCSSKGIYVQAVLMEITGYSIVSLYNYTNKYNFLTYLEYPIILIQLYVLTYYILKFNDMLCQPVVIIGIASYIFIVGAFLIGGLPKTILLYLVPLSTPISGFSKVTYIYGIIKARNADAVSLATWVLSMATNAGRIFTVLMDSADWKLTLNFTVSTLLSFCVFVTALYYKKNRVVRGDRRPVHDHID